MTISLNFSKRLRRGFNAAMLAGFLSGGALACQSDTVAQEDYDNLAILSAAGFAQLQASTPAAFELNGVWNSFSGSTALSPHYYEAFADGAPGILFVDAASFNSRALIYEFDNSADYYIAQNPPNAGGFNGDANKGKYFKIVFFGDGSGTKYWYCTLNATSPSDSIAAARAVVDNADRSSPDSAGCGGFSWTRLEKQ